MNTTTPTKNKRTNTIHRVSTIGYLLLLLILALGMIVVACEEEEIPINTTLYDVSVTVSPHGAGTISPSADSAYEMNQTVNLQAQANDEYLFAGWSGSVERSENPLSLTVDKAYGLTAHFELKSYELAVATEGAGTVIEQIVESKAREYAQGTVIELIAISNPDSSYRFVEWSGDLSGTENPAQITVDAPKEVTAVFEKKTYALTVLTEGQGAVTEEVVNPKAKEYEHGAVVELTPTPAEDWEFTGWQGDWSGTDNPARITVDEPKEVTAIFEQQAFFLAENGVTIKCPEAEVGQTGVVNGKAYTRRLRNQITLANAAATCTSGITDMSGFFDSGTGFNLDISHWDVSSVTNMGGMFRGATTFNGDLSGWDVSSVTDMSNMFAFSSFNGDISGWDVRSVTDMSNMFDFTSFNRDISGWDVSSVTDMGGMFLNASSFNQDLSGWCVSEITSEPTNFDTGAGFEGDAGKMPVWGTCPSP